MGSPALRAAASRAPSEAGSRELNISSVEEHRLEVLDLVTRECLMTILKRMRTAA
jgi:hypothetical protein